MREFAATTKVPIGTTRQQIESLLRLNKAARVVTMDEPDQILVGFILASRAIRYCVPLIKGTTEQRRRTKWRALALVIKAKFESVASGIETLEEAFLSQTVMPDRGTVYEWMNPQITKAIKDGRMPDPPLLELRK